MVDTEPGTGTRLFLVASGPTAATREGRFPLDEDLAGPLPNGRIRAGVWYCGPERRASASVPLIADPAPAQVRRDDRLAELNVGSWAGRSLAELATTEMDSLRQWLTDPGAAPHGGESLTALLDRVAAFLSGEFTGRSAAVTSPWVLRAALVHLLGGSAQRLSTVEVAPWEVLALTRRGASWAVRSLGPVQRR